MAFARVFLYLAIVDAMDKLKKEILVNFNKYLLKLTRGYTLEKKDYRDIIEAMRAVGYVENFTLPDYVSDTLISYHTLKLKNP